MRGVLCQSHAGFAWVAALAGPILFLGCAGSAQFRSGQERDLRGDLRGAYRDYHEAFLLSGKQSHKEARDRIGGWIAESIRLRALSQERSGEVDGALADCLCALEYDPVRRDLVRDLHRLEERTSRIEAMADRAGSSKGSWEAYRLWRDLRGEAVARPDVFKRIGEAAAAAADREIASLLGRDLPLAGEDPESPLEVLPESLPGNAAQLEALLAAWNDLSFRLSEVCLDDAEDRRASGLEALLSMRRSIAESAALDLEDALSAERLRSLAALSEKAGNLDEAQAAYQKASLLWPYRPEIRDGLARTSEAIEGRASIGVVQAMARKDWTAALLELSRLERLKAVPGEEVRRRSALCRKEIREAILREGSRLRGLGLPGNALCAFWRARDIGPEDPDLEREIVLLQESIRRRFQGDVDVEFREGNVEGADRSLQEEVKGAIDAAVQEGDFPHRRHPGEPLRDGAGPPSGTLRQALLVQVLDLRFDYGLKRQPAGRLESRFVKDFQEMENPEWARARDDLREAQGALERARADLSGAPSEKLRELQARVEIAEGRARRAAANLDQTQAHIPVPVWQSEQIPITRVLLAAALDLEARIDGEDQKLEVRLTAEDSEVDGDVVRGVIPDRPDLPPRGEVQRVLARRMAAELGARVKERLAARRKHLLFEARERLSADAYEACLENLVAFLYAERGAGQGPLFQEGIDLLRKVAGCEFPPQDPKAASSGPSSRRF